MIKFLSALFYIFKNELGVILLDDNLAQSETLFPPQKTSPNEVNARMKMISLRKRLDVIIAVNDEIRGAKVPEFAKIVDAYVQIDGSTGVGGIFDFGLRSGLIYDEASTNEDKLETFAEDQNALVNQADAGGAAVLKRSDATSIFLGGIAKKVGQGGLQLFIKCTEATTTTVATPRDLHAVCFYDLES